jgi:hypothetical protein
MNKRIIRLFVTLACLAAAIYVSFVSYALSTIDIEKLIVSSLHPATNRFPPGQPEFFLFHFRGNKKDLETLSKGKGLSFILSDGTAEPDQALKIATFFLNKGIDINLIGFDGLTALHSTVLQNQPNYVSYLLRHGADVGIGVNYSHVFGKKEKSAMFAPLLQKSEAFSLRAIKGEAVVDYCDPLIARRMGASGFPGG